MAAKDVLSFRTSDDMVRAVEERAWAEGVPVSEVLRSAVRVYLRQSRLKSLGFVDGDDGNAARSPEELPPAVPDTEKKPT